MIEAERIFEAREALAATLARDVAEELERAIEAKGRATLAVSGGKRLAAMPEVPTIAESGYPGFNAGTYFSVAARKGTPAAVVERLSQEIRRISGAADLAATFAPQGIDMSPGSAEELAAMLKADRARFAKVIKDAGIAIEQ